MMDTNARIRIQKNKWLFNDYKQIKIFGKDNRIAFQRKGKYVRGVSISKEALLKMDDVSLTPGMQMELEPNVWLKNYGNGIQLTKYCITHDGKQCNGGFFIFTPKEWQSFWNSYRKEILIDAYLES